MEKGEYLWKDIDFSSLQNFYEDNYKHPPDLRARISFGAYNLFTQSCMKPL